MQPEGDFLFEAEETDTARERFEIISIKLDIHKNGVIYLKELHNLLQNLPLHQRKPIAEFLVAYMKQTKKVIIKLPDFVSNIMKAYENRKFGLGAILE